MPLENVHPLQSGLLRLKHPSERRPGLKREHPLLFWPRFTFDTIRKHVSLAGTIINLSVSAFLIARKTDAKTYADKALTPVGDDDEDVLDLFTKTAGGTAAVSHIKKVAELTHAHKAI